MAVVIENDTVSFEGVIYEEEVVPLRDFLQNQAPSGITCKFHACDDLHFAVLQELLAYQKLYECQYEFGSGVKIYQKVLEGFDPSENHCN